MSAPVVRFRIDFAKNSSVGPGKIALLEAIRDSGSLSQGARNMGMSYRRAWLLIESLKETFREPVTLASTGGRDGGGMQVTEFGAALIRNYRELERDFTTLAARRLHAVRDRRRAGRSGVHRRRKAAARRTLRVLIPWAVRLGIGREAIGG
jgi:molybdate transport system regulatory protein